MRHGYQEIDISEDFYVREVLGVEVPKLAGFTVKIRWQITSGENSGYYIGEEYHGLPHPYLLIPESDVVYPNEEMMP